MDLTTSRGSVAGHAQDINKEVVLTNAKIPRSTKMEENYEENHNFYHDHYSLIRSFWLCNNSEIDKRGINCSKYIGN